MAIIDEPDFELIAQRPDYEVRRYAPYLVAETVVEADFRDAGREAFRRLFGYISGGNRRSDSIAMTAPVKSGSPAGEKIDMTAPVVSERTATPDRESHLYQFVMPAGFSLETLPVPDDPRVTLRAVEARTVAVHRYSGRWTEARYERAESALLSALARDGVDVVGRPLLARYNGPFTPWFLRRNEVLVPISFEADGERTRSSS